MTKKNILILLIIISTISISFIEQTKKVNIEDERFVSYTFNPKKQNLEFYWKNEKGENFKNIENLKLWLKQKNKKLIFGTNGGMYKKNNSTQGLYIEKGNQKMEIDTTTGNGNFYLKPNGVFYITVDKKPTICSTEKFSKNKNINFATQSGPMLVIDGNIHSAFLKNSVNLNIRNGAGVLPNNQIIFAMSKKEINFYEFAEYFKELGCKNALYLDGYVSRTYMPEKKVFQTDGNFGVIIGVSK